MRYTGNLSVLTYTAFKETEQPFSEHKTDTVVEDYQNEGQSCLMVSLTACLTSFIFQQYSAGFNDEFK